MDEFRNVLERASAQFPTPEMPLEGILQRRDRRRRNERIAAGAVGLAVASISILIATSIFRSGHAPASPQPVPAPRGAEITWTAESGIMAVDIATGEVRTLVPDVRASASAWSPDGTEVAYTSRAHPCSLVVRNIETGDTRVLATACGGSSVDWSADGNWIAFSESTGGPEVLWINLIHPDGSGERRLEDEDGFPVTAYAFSLSPSGSQIVFGSGPELYVMNVDGTGRRFLTNGSWPDWSSDGSTIAFERDPRLSHANGDPFVWQAWSVRPDGTGMAKLHIRKHCCLGLHATGPVWSPDGSYLAAVVRGRLQLIAADGDTRTIPGVNISQGVLAWRSVP